MLPSLGFGEIVVLALLAIIVVGPKDLPKLMRSIGQIMGRIRAMSQEFKDAFNDMDAEDEIGAMRREIEELKRLGHIDGELDNEMRDLDDEMRGLDAQMRTGVDMSSPLKPDILKSETLKSDTLKPDDA